jgi:hypothetical protein
MSTTAEDNMEIGEALDFMDRWLGDNHRDINSNANHLLGCCGTCSNLDRGDGFKCRISGFPMEITEGCFSEYKIDLRYDTNRRAESERRGSLRPWVTGYQAGL